MHAYSTDVGGRGREFEASLTSIESSRAARVTHSETLSLNSNTAVTAATKTKVGALLPLNVDLKPTSVRPRSWESHLPLQKDLEC